jgi:hypothetical protein
MFERLRAVDPQHEFLRSDERWSRERLYANVNDVVALAEQLLPTLPQIARPYVTEIAGQARMLQMVDEAPEPGGLAVRAARLEIVQYKIFEIVFALRAALGDRTSVVMNPLGEI